MSNMSYLLHMYNLQLHCSNKVLRFVQTITVDAQMEESIVWGRERLHVRKQFEELW